MQRVRNYFIRTLFKQTYSQNIESCEVLLGVPPIELVNSIINVKFFYKSQIIERSSHCSPLFFCNTTKSTANLLESHLRRSAKFVTNDSRFYVVDHMNDFLELMWRRRWPASHNNSSLECYTETTLTYNHFTPLLNCSEYEDNKI